MPSFDPRQMAMNLIMQNPQVANNPQVQEYLQIIQNGDTEKGQQIADNLCQSFGVSRDEAISQAKRFFGLPF